MGQLEQVLAEHQDVLEGRQLQGSRSGGLQDLPGTLYSLQVTVRLHLCKAVLACLLPCVLAPKQSSCSALPALLNVKWLLVA